MKVVIFQQNGPKKNLAGLLGSVPMKNSIPKSRNSLF
jgi:hypothetical protein